MRSLLVLVGLILLVMFKLNSKEYSMAWDDEINKEKTNPKTSSPKTLATPTVQVLQDERSSTGVSESTQRSDRITPNVGYDIIVQDEDTLSQGDRDAGPGGIISSVQTQLNALGLNVGDVDGVIGRRTSEAIQDAQGMLGLPRTGVLDEKTQLGLTTLSPNQINFLKNNPKSEAGYQNLGENVPVTPSGAVETSPRPQERPAINVDTAQVEAPVVDIIDFSPEVSTTEEALETAVIDVPEQAIQNPVQYIVDGNLIGLNESAANPTMQETIVGFFNNSLVNSTGFATTGSGPTSVSNGDRAWCATFVDHVLTNLGLPRLQTFTKERGKPVYYDRVRAKQYMELGEAQTIETAQAGDIVVQKSGSQWHVGFYVGTLTAVPTDTAEQVTPIQEALISAGRELPRFGADGDYGGETKAAVAGYQEEQGLEATGVMDEETYTSLMGVKPQVTYSGFLSLGGNQNNEVNLTAYPMSKLQGIRRVGAVQDLDVETFEAISQDINYAAGTR